MDAGGGTIDISAYRRTSPTLSQSFEEIAAPQCKNPLKQRTYILLTSVGHFHGSIFVTNLAQEFLSSGYLI